MSRIGATLTGVERFLLTQLARVDQAAVENSVRIATGKKVNSPSDDPAAFFLISSFENRLNVVKSTKSQVDVAASIGSEAQLALGQIRSQLDTIRGLLAQAIAGTLADPVAAQAQIDDAIDQVDTLANTEINGRRYLDGSVNYRVSGRNSTQVSNVEVFTIGQTTISGSVQSTATRPSLTYNGGGGSIIDSGDSTFELTGKRGTATISVTDTEALSDVRDRINLESHNTGITAEVSGNDLIFTAVDYGDKAIIDINVTIGAFNTAGTTQGSDAVATINGVTVSSNNVDGNRVTHSSNGLHVAIDFNPGFTGTFDTMTVSDENVAKLALTTDLTHVTRFAVPTISAFQLGGVSGRLEELASGGTLSGLGSEASQAVRVIDEAIGQLTLIEGRVDAFADVTVASSSALLDGFTSTLEDTLDNLDEVDTDEESVLLAKNQTLGANTVAALSVLNQQRAAILAMIQLAATSTS